MFKDLMLSKFLGIKYFYILLFGVCLLILITIVNLIIKYVFTRKIKTCKEERHRIYEKYKEDMSKIDFNLITETESVSEEINRLNSEHDKNKKQLIEKVSKYENIIKKAKDISDNSRLVIIIILLYIFILIFFN